MRAELGAEYLVLPTEQARRLWLRRMGMTALGIDWSLRR